MKKRLTITALASLALAVTMGIGLLQLPVSAAASTYDTYFNVKSNGSGLMIEPTLIFEPSAFSEFNLSGNRPASVIVTPDEEMKVTLGNDTKTLKRTFDNYIKGKYIPIVRLTESTVDPFLTWLKKTYKIKDIMAISDDIEVIQKLFADESGYLVNTVYDLTRKTIDSETLSSDRYAEWEHVGEANAAGCNILMYDGNDPNLPIVAEYVESLTRVCWAEVDSKEEAVAAIAAGCYGIVGKDASVLTEALSVFEDDGFARAQYVAAHRGITRYANEQSLTGVMASANEGATHVEIDVQITADRAIVLGHDSSTARVADKTFTFEMVTQKQLSGAHLNNYSAKYNDTFASLDDVITQMAKTDVILIVELKFSEATKNAVENLKPIEILKETMDRHPEIKGHWYAITFFSPWAKEIRKVMPEIPVGYLGAGESGLEKSEQKVAWGGEHKSMTDIAGKIDFLRRYNIGLDESMASATNSTAANYLARGYTQNTWTFEDLSHFGYRANVATSNAEEDCAMLVKTIDAEGLELTEEQLAKGTVTVPCTTYNGWKVERECKVIVSQRKEGAVQAVLYLKQEGDGYSFGLYSQAVEIALAE